jgi:hypothetical protein
MAKVARVPESTSSTAVLTDIGVSTTQGRNAQRPSRARESVAVFNRVNGTGEFKSNRPTMERLILRLTRNPQLTAD